jgi:hypothetical protein
MNITHYELRVSDAKINREIRLSYLGNEDITVYLNYEDGADRYIDVPRSVLENFVRLINECR